MKYLRRKQVKYDWHEWDSAFGNDQQEHGNAKFHFCKQ